MRVLCFDLETWLSEPGDAAPRMVCLAYEWLDTGERGLLGREDGLAWITARLSESDIHFVNQNIAFDFCVIAAERPDLLEAIFAVYDAGRVSCTMTRELLIQIALGQLGGEDNRGGKWKFNLAELVKQYLNRDISESKTAPDAWRLRYCELDGVPVEDYPEEARAYPLSDVRNTLDVFACQIAAAERAEVLGEDGMRLVNEAEQSAAAWALYLMRAWGLRADGERVAALAAAVAARAERLDTLQREYGLVHEATGKKNTKALQALIVKVYGEANAPRTASGRVATDKETLLNSGNETLIDIAEAGESLSAVKNTFLPALSHAINVPATPWWKTLVSSGRISCGDPNLTNQPRSGGVRECWRARDGFYFINADYSMAELRSLAQVTYTLFGESKMRDALNEDRELHLLTASTLLGLTYEETVKRYKAGDKAAKQARQLSKAINFGLGGGMGAETFVKTAWKDYRIKLGESHEAAIEEAKRLKRLWIETYPEMAEYFRHVGALGDTFAVLQHVSGRLRGGLSYCSGANTLFQGLTADGVKAALYYASRECYTGRSEAWEGDYRGSSPLFGSRMNAMIHDELMGESPIDRAAEAAVRLGDVMRYGMKLYTPDVKVVVEPVLMRRWFKDAKPVFDAVGRLLPWEPETDAA